MMKVISSIGGHKVNEFVIKPSEKERNDDRIMDMIMNF